MKRADWLDKALHEMRVDQKKTRYTAIVAGVAVVYAVSAICLVLLLRFQGAI